MINFILVYNLTCTQVEQVSKNIFNNQYVSEKNKIEYIKTLQDYSNCKVLNFEKSS